MGSRLKHYVAEIEKLVEERQSVNEEAKALRDQVREINKSIKTILKAAENAGYKQRVVKLVLERRAEDPYEVSENDSLVHQYEQELEDKPSIGHNSRGAKPEDGYDI